MSKIIPRSSLGFLSGIFLNIWRKDQQKICVRFFRICRYALLIFEKGVSKKRASGFLGFVSVLFLIFENGIR